MRVLLVEDEKKVASFIARALREEGFTVDAVHDGSTALDFADATSYEVIILDVMLPGRDGLSVLKLLRGRRNPAPVLLLTARGEVSERIEGLELGADDYMAKPFAMGELLARVKALCRRSGGERATLLQVADLSLNLLTREARRGTIRVELTLREHALLESFMRSAGRVLSRTRLCESVWEHHFDTGTNVVDVYVNRLRRKIDDGHATKLFHTVRGVGYMLSADP